MGGDYLADLHLIPYKKSEIRFSFRVYVVFYCLLFGGGKYPKCHTGSALLLNFPLKLFLCTSTKSGSPVV